MAATGTPTTNLGLRIMNGTDPVDVADINANSQTLDDKIGAVPSGTSVQAQITSANQAIGTLNSKINFTAGTLSGDVITAINNASIGVTFFKNSNKPNNRPSGCDWGAYYIIKDSSTNASVIYMHNNSTACAYAIDATTATSLTWFISTSQSEVDAKLSWNYINQLQNVNDSLQFPSDAKEILFVQYNSNGGTAFNSLHIPNNIMPSAFAVYSSVGEAIISRSSSTLTLTNNTNSSIVKVYYR